MDALIGKIEKAKPFFEKVSRNKYLKAIRDGFMSAMPVVLFSSIFMYLLMYQTFLDSIGLVISKQ